MDSETASQLFQDARALIEARAYQPARHMLLRILGHHPSATAFHELAGVHLALGDGPQALTSIERAISLDPGNLESRVLALEIFHVLARPRDVIAGADEILARAPGHGEALLMKARAFEALLDFERSTEEKKRYLHTVYDTAKGIDDLDRRDADYHINHVSKRNSVYLDYPAHVQFETFAQCNATCSFCVYPDLARKGELMPMSLIDKIIGDLEAIPADIKFQLSPYCVNEPFLDKRIFEVLDKISTRLPNAVMTLTSNASPITPEILKRLAQYKIGFLWLSVVDYRKDVYEAKMKLSFDRLLSRLQMIHAAKAEGRFTHTVVISRLTDNSEHDALFAQFMAERFPLFDLALWPYANWIHRTDNEVTSSVANIPCHHWFEMRIDATGIVQLCCMDGHSEYPWGDVRTQSILDIYNQKSFRDLRANTFSRLETTPCDGCNMR